LAKIGRVLVTGGAGFIGSHTVDALIAKGYSTRVLDNLEPQVHGKKRKPPAYLNKKAEFMYGDLRNRNDIVKAIKDIDALIHLAAKVGVGQSMYQIEDYTESNTFGTANLLDVLVNEENDVKKLVIASSMSIYGEGKYFCEKCGPVYPDLRGEEQLKKCDWEQRCPSCGRTVKPVSVDEEKPLQPLSVYAQTKRHQEEMCLLIGKTYEIPTIALRYFNVYGPHQALNNPYTGVCAIFSCRIMTGKQPYIFEDGKQTRDFIHVKDVATANILALEKKAANYKAYNVGSGRSVSIIELAENLLKLYRSKLLPIISNKYRAGDIRHAVADITKIKKELGFKPSISIDQGMKDLVGWAKNQKDITDKFEQAQKELEERGLTLKTA